MSAKNTKYNTIEAIVQEFNKQSSDRIKDATGQKVFRVNKKTGVVTSELVSLILPESVFSTLRNTVSSVLPESVSAKIPDGYYLISNSNFVHRATHSSDTISVQDNNGRKIDLSIRCEISCPPGNEEKTAKFLLAHGNRPSYNLNLFLRKCVYRFQEDIEKFIFNFYESDLPGKIEKFVMEQKDPSNPSIHVTGLVFHAVKCVQINKPEEVIPIRINNIKVGFNDSVTQHSIMLKCNLGLSTNNNKFIHWKNISKEEFENKITNWVETIYYRSISETDSFKNVNIVENTVRDNLNVALKKYNREIVNLELKDLNVESVTKNNIFNIKSKRKKYLSRDRSKIDLKVSVTVKITDLIKLRTFKEKNNLLKEELTDFVDKAITSFIINVTASEFYDRIATDLTFRKSFVEAIRQEINTLITAEVKVRDVDYGETHDPEKTWTFFKAEITRNEGKFITRNERKFVITGSFLYVRDDTTRTHIKRDMVFSVDDIKTKIEETLEAKLEKTYSESSQEFEGVIIDLISKTVSEAYGIIIKVQNIKVKLTGLSFEDEVIIEKIRDLKTRKIDIIASGGSVEQIVKIDERIAKLEEYREQTFRSVESNLLPSKRSFSQLNSKNNSSTDETVEVVETETNEKED